MIDHISIKNFAIIEDAQIDFHSGLNIVTGETGSGKSILIEAISLALGSRADSSCIRTGCDSAVVQLMGHLNGEEIIITRKLSSSGKNICKLNGEIVPLSQISQIASKLADIHGQYDNQSLLNPDYHISLLDGYKKEKLNPLKNHFLDLFHSYNDVKQKLKTILSKEQESKREREFLSFQLSEIENAHIVIGEDTNLEQKISILQNSEKIHKALDYAIGSIFDGSPSLSDCLGTTAQSLNALADLSDEFKSLGTETNDLYYRLQDLSHSFRSIRDNTSFSPEELDISISRLHEIEQLKKKYGPTIEDIIKYQKKLKEKLSLIEGNDNQKSTLEEALKKLKHQVLASAKDLSECRIQIASDLEAAITNQLKDLNFNDCNLSISVETSNVITENGMDKVEFLISTNKGQPLKPLSKIASGGEMSRIMLAFKNIISAYDMIPCLIFDEIDTGISGLTASIVGRKLKEISSNRQIICITHLPQIAAFGNYNYRIYKTTGDEKTFTSVEELSSDEKIQEIARLLGGTTITDSTLNNARDLINQSK